jgi:serine/threonine-protein kinase
VTTPTDPGTGRDETRDASQPVIGQIVGGRYRIDALIARGGMARVYRSRDLRLDRDVAVKILAAPYADTPAFAERFLAEARAVAGVSQPNLVHVYDSGSSDGLRYIVMELLDGYRSLRSVLAERERLPPAEVIGIVRQLLAGLAVVHEHGLVHCDVKPGNVMAGREPVKLIDFGIARAPHVVSAERTSLGSLHAMAPEQLRGEQLTPASDLFAVGAVLYVALTGRVPYPGDEPQQVLDSAEAGRPVSPSALVDGVPPALDAVVLQALDPLPARRFESAAAMSRALQVAAGALDRTADDTTQMVAAAPAPAAPRPAAVRRPSPARNSTAPILMILVLATLAVAGVAWLLTRGSSVAPGASTPPVATQTLPPGRVRVPNTVGLTEAEGEAQARRAGLNWTIRWQQTNAHRPGIYDQEPAAGEVVSSGSRFTMFAYRPAD